MNRVVRVAVVGIGMTLATAACGPVGSGDIVVEERSVGEFDSISVSDALTVEVVVDDSEEHSVVVNYDDNVIDQIVTEVRGSTLHLEMSGSISSFGGSRRYVAVTVPVLDELVISGAVDIEVEGSVSRYVLQAAGASDADLRNLIADDVTIEISGASDVVLYAAKSVSGEVSGASDVNVRGNPSDVSVETTGASDFDVAP